MRVRHIKICELKDFVNSEEFKKMPIIPITRHRALSQVKNPRADPNDVVLSYVEENGEVIAYVGALPDKILGNEKVAWNSCWYAHPSKGKFIALPLFLQFVENYNDNILLQDLTPHTSKIIRSLPNFVTIKKLLGLRLFFKFNTEELLPLKIKWTRRIKILLRFLDFCANKTISVNNFLLKRRTEDCCIEKIKEIDDESKEYIDLHNGNELVGRGKQELDWIMNNPWVLQKDSLQDDNVHKYFFSSSCKIFDYHIIKFRIEDKLVAWMILRQKNFDFETPCIYMEANTVNKIVRPLTNYLLSQKAITFTTFHQLLAESLDRNIRGIFVFKRNIERSFIASKKLQSKILNDAQIQDGDGDVIFT